ncbi:hypothetical protein THAOC_35116 [Thalassiosira oceanica]|uniref:Uncharacterized protein n=1 Tax=Thalassiosira oceanica TaxID=159749 RepID=K0R3X7_THAOC|nr:hypothetical protein THAOC_35116 [Thalassiosira oceanica]|eukprot:EJK46229.1 hypothetical protein THAOC_35116 [Thalassiosira oceanica]
MWTWLSISIWKKHKLSAKPSSQSNSAFIEPGPIRAWRKLVDREKEFEKELEGAVDVPSTTCNRYGCCSIPGETCGRNGIPSNGSCILMRPSGCRHFGPDYYPYAPSRRKHFARKLGLERLRLSRDIDDMNEFKKRRPANYSIPSPKEADADSSDGSEVSSLGNASVGGHWPGR